MSAGTCNLTILFLDVIQCEAKYTNAFSSSSKHTKLIMSVSACTGAMLALPHAYECKMTLIEQHVVFSLQRLTLFACTGPSSQKLMQKLPGYLEGPMGLLWVLCPLAAGGHTPQDTPGYSNLVFDNTLFETEVTACLCWVYCLWVL